MTNSSLTNLRGAFEQWCREYCSPGADSSEWYWRLFKAGAEAALRGATDEPVTTKTIVRFDLEQDPYHDGCNYMSRDPTGEWVRYEDIEHLLAVEPSERTKEQAIVDAARAYVRAWLETNDPSKQWPALYIAVANADGSLEKPNEKTYADLAAEIAALETAGVIPPLNRNEHP